MVDHLSPQSSTRQQWHERIERYTPDGAFGRFLLAILLGPLGILSLIYGSAALFAAPTLLPWLPLGLVLIAGGVVASTIAVLMFWAIYLSVIGNVESAKTYPQMSTTRPAEENRDDSIAVAKRQYAAGNITEEEFERRVENLLHADVRLQSRTTQREGRETLNETN